MTQKKQFLKFDLTIFEKNDKNEFVKIVTQNKIKTAKAFAVFLINLKNEANGTKETSRIIVKYVSKQKITKTEEKHLKTQVVDIFKIVGIGVPFILIPGATLLIPFVLKIAEKKGINLLPSNFKGDKKI